ncbi:MAG: restriction endonuclease subunit S, partial [Bacteroidales bacterium]|nr:restriction endonuclease subunit S [Bacteroidales bacterium]
MPFEVPASWAWTTLGEIGDIITGSTPPKDITEYYGGNIPFYKPTDLEQGINTKISTDTLTALGYNQSRKIPVGSVLVTCIGATIGKTGLISTEGACNQQINAIIPSRLITSLFLYYFCISGYFQKEIRNNASATTLPILNK